MAPHLITSSVSSPDGLDDLAWAIDRDGIAAHLAEVGAVAQTARRAGVRPVLTNVLLDDRLPEPVRERAFGLLAMTLAQTPVVHLSAAA